MGFVQNAAEKVAVEEAANIPASRMFVGSGGMCGEKVRGEGRSGAPVAGILGVFA